VERTTPRAMRAISRWRDEGGQAVVLSVVWMVVLLGMAGLVIDVGSWYRAQRNLQSDADAAALAGAQELPNDTGTAGVMAVTYAKKNGYTLTGSGIAFTGARVPNDSITVKVKAPSPTFFTKLFGVNSVDIDAKATARSDEIGKAKYVAPITVNINHPLLSGQGCPCFDVPTTLPLDKRGAPGAFGLLDLDNGKGNGSSQLGAWVRWGYNGYLDVGDYSSNTGAKFDSQSMDGPLDSRLNTVLLFPVYDTLVSNGTNATYHIIAWVGFYLTGYDISGNNGVLYGHFTDITWEGIPATSNNGQPNLGVRVVTLTN
jgi:Flp pilus assembly protein TadG